MMARLESIGRARPPGAPLASGAPRARRSGPVIALLIFLFVRPISALTPGDLSRVTFEQHSGQQISRDLVFHDDNNQLFRLGDHFGREPTVLVLGYYRCPMLCTAINDGLIGALQNLRESVGRDFNVIDLSIDPNETAITAATKKALYLRRYGRAGAAEGWHFLVGDERSIRQIANEVGFRYVYDPQIQQYAHPSGVIVLTPDGKISRYIFGVTFEPKELLDALEAARAGKSESVFSRLFLLCYHYNPITGKYGGLILSILRVSSVAVLLALIGFVTLMVGRDRRARRPISDGPAVRPYH